MRYLLSQAARLNLRRMWPYGLAVMSMLGLLVWTRLADLGGYVIVDEADRWRWAEAFYRALVAGDLRATLVGDGYPGIVPVWMETLWLLAESLRRSVLEGHWIGNEGVYMLFHVWGRTSYLAQQRLPIALLNILLAGLVGGYTGQLFGRRVGLIALTLIVLDPFYLSDSRVNRAEAVITGLMTLSILNLIYYDRKRQWRYIILSGVFGGLSFLTKIQALVLLPIIALVGWVVFSSPSKAHRFLSFFPQPSSFVKFGLVWLFAAGLIWFLLWPSMWVIPLDTLTLVYNYATRKVDSEGVNLFFWGQTYQNTDPGVFFYPVVFLMRLTPVALLGLIGFVSSIKHQVSSVRGPKSEASPDIRLMARGNLILVIYVLVYALLMTIGSHKQDRYLMPIFLSVDILAAVGLVYLGRWLKHKLASRLSSLSSYFLLPTAYCLLLSLQLVTVLPHHPYYYSFFNPLVGGGQTAVQVLRVGWGEGMDQAGAYLAAKPNSRDLVVSSRFTHNMLDFKGKLISLGQDGRWTQADYIVLYIQQVQRRLDPTPGFVDYFQAKQPEKVITIGGIDYAWIYPIPFTVPANPQLSVIPGQVALLGYSWEMGSGKNAPNLRLLWENQGATLSWQLVARLVSHNNETKWTICAPDPHFASQIGQIGAYVESLCAPEIANLPPGIYTVEFGLTSQGGEVESFLFPQGWQAAQVTPGGNVTDTGEKERLEAIVVEAIPPAAQRVDRVYDGRVRLVAYQLEPAMPKPGESVTLTLYWQRVNEILTPITLTVQLADSRSISLGRSDIALYTPPPTASETSWLPGEVISTHHEFALLPDLDVPLAAQIEVNLLNEDEVSLTATNLDGESVEKAASRFTIASQVWPSSAGITPVEAGWQDGIMLRGYKVTSAQGGQSLAVSLWWEANQPVAGNYVVFVHLLDMHNQLKMQSDGLPRAGAYPTQWWLPGQTIEDVHILARPQDLPAGVFRLAVGLYRVEDNVRLRLTDGRDSLVIGPVQVEPAQRN